LKKAIQKETRFSHIVMRVNASETLFFKFNNSMFLCVKNYTQSVIYSIKPTNPPPGRHSIFKVSPFLIFIISEEKDLPSFPSLMS
jgi:hypothetical protein